MIFQITDNPDQVSFSDFFLEFFRILTFLLFTICLFEAYGGRHYYECTQKYFVYSFQHSRLMMMI